MSGRKNDTSGARSVTTSGSSEWLGGTGGNEATAAGWERCVAGEDVIDEVRPAILASWLRCRDEYKVEPWREEASAPSTVEPSRVPGDDVVLAELGGLAKSLEAKARDWRGVAAVADGHGRILAEWGDPRVMSAGREHNFARWASWSERNAGTNGLGTAVESAGAILIRQSEHWCAPFQDWTCLAIAIRDPVTSVALGVLDISVFESVPDEARHWLQRLVGPLEADLRRGAERSRFQLLSAFATHERGAHGLLLAMDNAGRPVAANAEGRRLLGLPIPAGDGRDAGQLGSETFELRDQVLQAVRHGNADGLWIGSAQVSLPGVGAELAVTLRPVTAEDHVVGVLIDSATFDGEPLSPGAPPPEPTLTRILALRKGRLVLLTPDEIRFAYAEGNTVWITTDQDRLRAFSRGLVALEEKVRGHGFLRVSRNCMVNLARVREIAPSFKGGFALVMDGSPQEVVPVSRRHASQVRRLLGL